MLPTQDCCRDALALSLPKPQQVGLCCTCSCNNSADSMLIMAHTGMPVCRPAVGCGHLTAHFKHSACPHNGLSNTILYYRLRGLGTAAPL
jgi:hypothetical protein